MKKIIFLTLIIALLNLNANAQWQQTSLDSVMISCIIFHNNNIYLGTQGYGMYYSLDNGNSWIQRYINGGTLAFGLAINNSNYIFAGTDQFIQRSPDNGQTWTQLGTGVGSAAIVNVIYIKGDSILAGGDSGEGVDISTNNGDYWYHMNNGLTSTTVWAIASKGNYIYSGTEYGMQITSNNGGNWAASPHELNLDTTVFSLAIEGNNIFAGTYNSGIYLSTDNGSNWAAINSGLPNSSGFYNCINAIVTSGNNIFIGTGGGNGGVYWSNNNGSSWTGLNSGFPFDTIYGYGYIYSLAIKGDTLYAGRLNTGLWRYSLIDLGIKEVDYNITFSIYPNPATNNIIIEIPPLSTIEISNIQGQLIKQQTTNNKTTTIDVSSLPCGVYVVQVKTEKGIAVKKFIKE